MKENDEEGKKLACGLEKLMENGKKDGNERNTGRQNLKRREIGGRRRHVERERMNQRERKKWRNGQKKTRQMKQFNKKQIIKKMEKGSQIR